MAKEIVKKDELLPETLQMFESEAGAGMEGMTTADLAIPFLAILQTNSPQLNRSESVYVKEAVAGQIFNTVSSKVYDEITVVPCAFAHKVVEWRPRGSGGGLVAQYERENAPEDVTINDKGQMQRTNGNVLLPTAYHYVIVIDDFKDDLERAILPMSSTQLKKSKKWNSIMGAIKLKSASGELFTPPIYSHTYQLSTAGESNDKGKWFGWTVSGGTIIQDPKLIQLAREFSKSAKSISLKPTEELM